MNKLWQKYAPYWHICMAILFCVFWVITNWTKVDGYEGRISTLEIMKAKQEKKITRMDYNIQLISRAVGVKPLEKGDDE